MSVSIDYSKLQTIVIRENGEEFIVKGNDRIEFNPPLKYGESFKTKIIYDGKTVGCGGEGISGVGAIKSSKTSEGK